MYNQNEIKCLELKSYLFAYFCPHNSTLTHSLVINRELPERDKT